MAIRQYGLLGRKLGHSFSRNFFAEFFASNGVDAEYLNFELADIRSLPELLKNHPNLDGFNVTVPYKQQILPYLHSTWDGADECPAVNTVKIKRLPNGDVRLAGYNTDIIGFRQTLEPLLRPDIRAALVLGTGGASQAVCYVLRRLGIDYKLVSRTPRSGMLTYADLDAEVMAHNLLIINTTPLGMWPDVDSSPDLPYHLITPEHVCYDLVYNPDVTRFMVLSASRGATVKNGLEMLRRQALASWNIWQDASL